MSVVSMTFNPLLISGRLYLRRAWKCTGCVILLHYNLIYFFVFRKIKQRKLTSLRCTD